MPGSITLYRKATGEYLNQLDKRQPEQKFQNERIQKLATQPGSRNRQLTATAVVHLLSLFSSVRNTPDTIYGSSNLTEKDTTGNSADLPNRKVFTACTGASLNTAPSRYLSENTVPVSVSDSVSSVHYNPSESQIPSTSFPINMDTSSGSDVENSFLSTVFSDIEQFISRYDPLKFPSTEARVLPVRDTEVKAEGASILIPDLQVDIFPPSESMQPQASIIIDSQDLLKPNALYVSDVIDKNRTLHYYSANTTEDKKHVIQELINYFKLSNMTSDSVAATLSRQYTDISQSEPICVIPINTHADDVLRVQSAPAKISIKAHEDIIKEHIKANCAYEEEVLTPEGENKGKLLIFQAQKHENPYRGIYDNNPNVAPSPEQRAVADASNLLTDMLTFGLKTIVGKLIANAKRHQYYKNSGDHICAERYRRLIVAEFATALDIDGLPYTPRGVPRRVKPSEVRHALPEQNRAAFFTRNPHNGISKEILLELKQGTAAINDNGRRIFLKPTSKNNEFVTHHPYAVKPENLERRVIVDENNLSWRYADVHDTSGLLNIHISEGKSQVKLHGDNYELQKNSAGKYEIVVNKPAGVTEFIPVYMEPLSGSWHLSTHNEHAAFSKKQVEIINKIKYLPEEGYNYTPRGNNNQKAYGNGNVYVMAKDGDSSNYVWGRYIEMNGELVPVKTVVIPGHGVRYEVYDVKMPSTKGYPVEWDGNRWLFERKTSIHASKALKKLMLQEVVTEKVDVGNLSAPDHQGLRYDIEGDKYIKIKNNYFKLEFKNGLSFLRMNNGDEIYVDYVNSKFKPTVVNRHNGLVSSTSNEVVKDYQINSLAGLDVGGSSLNEAWTLRKINVKNKDFSKTDAVGSDIDVTFTMEYSNLKSNRYVEMPTLQWKETINLKEGDSKWSFNTDMYNHNPNSSTFSSWLNRYVEAYNFAKAKDKASFNGKIKIYKNNMKPVCGNDIKNAYTPDGKVKSIQNFLSKNGGVMEITITDSPRILKRDTNKNKERKLTFDIGFKDEVKVHLNQGIFLDADGRTNVFVTASDNINLATGNANAQPPEIVSTPRVHHFMSGEVY